MTSEVKKVEYYLASGAMIEYAYSPGSSILELIQSVVDQYAEQTTDPTLMPRDIFLRTDAVAVLRGEFIRVQSLHDFGRYNNQAYPRGYEQMVVQTAWGPIAIKPVHGIRWPVFYGSRQEYIDNDFNVMLERHLKE